MYRILFLLLFPAMVFGQTAQETVDRKLKLAKGQFQTTNESDFVIATPYVKNYAGIAGSPFWATDVWNSADILYKGIMYQVSELKYDCANDLMVIPRYTKEGVILLNLIPSVYPEITINKKISSPQHGMATKSYFKQEHFIFYSSTKEENSDGVSTGYYHYLIEKPVSLLCKYSSYIVERYGQKKFEEEVKYYFQKEGKLIRIRRVESFIDAFPQWKDPINSFVEENKINTMMSLESGTINNIIMFINTLSTQ